MDTPTQSPELPAQLTIDELVALNGFRGVNPAAIFGLDLEHTPENTLHPTARTYSNIGLALQGAPLDDWARWGMYHGNRKPEFASFDAVTQGLDAEGRRRFCVILLQYLDDINLRAPDFKDRHFEMETLTHAVTWICDMLRGADKDSLAFVLKIEKWRGVIAESAAAKIEHELRFNLPPVVSVPAAPVPATTKTLRAKAKGLLGKILKPRS